MIGIVRDVPTQVASVEGSDDYGVVLRQVKRRVEYSFEEAIALATELLDVATAMRSAFHEDRAHSAELSKAPAFLHLAHGFDLAPSCRECMESKHGACDGSALVEVGAEADVQSVPCVCSASGHRMIGADS